jgi:hypothetical protein
MTPHEELPADIQRIFLSPLLADQPSRIVVVGAIGRMEDCGVLSVNAKDGFESIAILGAYRRHKSRRQIK